MPALHDDELAIDLPLVRRLLHGSFPELAGRPLTALPASGSSNALFRLGDDLLVRLPRQPGGSRTIEKEARWLAGTVPTAPFHAPDGGSPAALAADLARLVRELRAAPVPDAAHLDPELAWYRGGPLAALDDDFGASVRDCRAIGGLGLDLDRAAAVWRTALAAEAALPRRRTWFHGDLVAENLLVRDGRLAAVLDLGGLAVGDPAVDLIVAWEVLDPPARRAFRATVAADDAEWAVGAGWALLIAVLTFAYYWRSMPARCADRRVMAAAVLAER